MGRVCSASPGSTVDGMGAPRARHNGPAVGDGAPSIPVPADPPPEALFTMAALCGDRLMAIGLIHQWARVGAARAERAGGRSGARSGAGSAPGGAERSRGLIKERRFYPAGMRRLLSWLRT
jgi:hypothetical protein